jgi:hypothetical protein
MPEQTKHQADKPSNGACALLLTGTAASWRLHVQRTARARSDAVAAALRFSLSSSPFDGVGPRTHAAFGAFLLPQCPPAQRSTSSPLATHCTE